MTSSSNERKDKTTQRVIAVVTCLCTVALILLAVFVGVPRQPDYSGGSSGYPDSGASQWYTVSGTLSIGAIGRDIYVPTSGYVYYSFTPSSTGNYKFYSATNYSSNDPKAILYNSNWIQLQSDDDGGSGNNFSISHTLVEGVTYYLAIGQSRYDTTSGSYVTVYVEYD